MTAVKNALVLISLLWMYTCPCGTSVFVCITAFSWKWKCECMLQYVRDWLTRPRESVLTSSQPSVFALPLWSHPWIIITIQQQEERQTKYIHSPDYSRLNKCALHKRCWLIFIWVKVSQIILPMNILLLNGPNNNTDAILSMMNSLFSCIIAYVAFLHVEYVKYHFS